MKVFLTGGTGVVGTRALPALVAAGHDVTAVARGDAKATLVRRLGGTPVTVDLFDPDAVTHAVAGHHAVIHLATNIPPLSRMAFPSAWRVNDRLRVEGSANLVDAALAAGVAHYVQESVTFPYADGGDRWLDEDAPRDLIDIFEAPETAEATTARFTARGGTGVVLRFAQFYADDSVHVRAFDRIARWRINPGFGPADHYTTFVHAEDAGTAVAAALDAPAGIYNVGEDEPLTRRDAGAVVARAVGVPRVRSLPDAAFRVVPAKAAALTRSQRVSNAAFRAATGWSPAYPSIRGHWPGEVRR